MESQDLLPLQRFDLLDSLVQEWESKQNTKQQQQEHPRSERQPLNIRHSEKTKNGNSKKMLETSIKSVANCQHSYQQTIAPFTSVLFHSRDWKQKVQQEMEKRSQQQPSSSKASPTGNGYDSMIKFDNTSNCIQKPQKTLFRK